MLGVIDEVFMRCTLPLRFVESNPDVRLTIKSPGHHVIARTEARPRASSRASAREAGRSAAKTLDEPEASPTITRVMAWVADDAPIGSSSAAEARLATMRASPHVHTMRDARSRGV